MLGEIQWLSFKSKKTQQKEQEEYNGWAFPYGKAQEDALRVRLKELFPKEDPRFALICVLTCKEIFSDTVREGYYSPEYHDLAVNIIRKDLKRYRRLFRKGTSTTYFALGMADSQIGPELQYPSAEELRATGGRLDEEIRRIEDNLREIRQKERAARRARKSGV